MGVRLADHIDPRLVLADVEVDDIGGLFEQVAEAVGVCYPEISVSELTKRLMERECSSSTGIEGGLGLPHATIEGLPASLCVVIRTARPLPLPDPEAEPVRLLFLLLSPQAGMGLHVRLLARLARLCATRGFLDRLLDSPDSESLRWTVVEEDGRHV